MRCRRFAVHFHFEQGESNRVEACHDQGKDLVFFSFSFSFLSVTFFQLGIGELVVAYKM